jgi:hypothetical protein
MARVKMFADFAADAQDLVKGLADALSDWKACGAVIEIVSANTSITYDPAEEGVHGVLTVVYCIPGEQKEA